MFDVTGNITVSGTVDGRDVDTDGTTLDTLNTTTVPEIDTNVNDLVTLSGVAENATNLGTFTGSTIADNETIKGASSRPGDRPGSQGWYWYSQ